MEGGSFKHAIHTTGCKNVVYRLSKTELPKEQSSEKTTIGNVLCCASLTSKQTTSTIENVLCCDSLTSKQTTSSVTIWVEKCLDTRSGFESV